MNTTMNQNNKTFPIGFNIHLLSFSLPKNVIKDKEEIQVSITTMPEETKQHYHLHGRKMDHTNHVFSLNITNQTKRVIMVFRKKMFLSENPIIASTIIYSSDFPKLKEGTNQFNSDSISTCVKTLNIYYPLQKQLKEEGKTQSDVDKKNLKRKILGQMQVQMTFTSPYINNSKEKSNKNNNKTMKKSNDKISGTKLHKNKKSNMKGKYEEINSQNQFNCIYMNDNNL